MLLNSFLIILLIFLLLFSKNFVLFWLLLMEMASLLSLFFVSLNLAKTNFSNLSFIYMITILIMESTLGLSLMMSMSNSTNFYKTSL
uniref:NADH dehydrogenase subunit 4L n=1 Tax=Parachordodes pustulosus TaxID=3049253 RepID=UPI002E768B31|nr:NADH dehydrogenase subunit 4L [Parachordodes pustulosus]WQH58894.1 NADH dehydrogenase subunit 4L [Parachordodes pustulosus]